MCYSYAASRQCYPSLLPFAKGIWILFQVHSVNSLCAIIRTQKRTLQLNPIGCLDVRYDAIQQFPVQREHDLCACLSLASLEAILPISITVRALGRTARDPVRAAGDHASGRWSASMSSSGTSSRLGHRTWPTQVDLSGLPASHRTPVS